VETPLLKKISAKSDQTNCYSGNSVQQLRTDYLTALALRITGQNRAKFRKRMPFPNLF